VREPAVFVRESLRVGQGAELLLTEGAQIPETRRDHSEGCFWHGAFRSEPELAASRQITRTVQGGSAKTSRPGSG